ncbi:hypothetical protein TRFO_26443 [Tritrichomonas foetus]|uniref:Uncharacterized protein n=1 Tax=Tritrichomonas foetus TaxID=1144522 RepID=A0A1J4K3K4_9EUKA|nr:hypothetical protein TRFO_26443 [Tritrichomonas foetus]|eukprot:OHT05763.1 hypothetical protein TRFO_26443 [Tritrichomonas foetus]
MDSTPDFMRVFTLWANNRPYDLDGPTFSRMSKKCGKLMQQGQTQGVLVRRVRNDTITAFVAACQLQPFKVTRNSAFELLDIAYEWEVATLIKFVNDYVSSKGISRPHDVDCIAELLKHCNKKNYAESDIIAVSNIVNTALADPRLPQVPPEMDFRILLAADQRSIDQQLLLDFVITLFNENAQAAAPLISLIDFSRLTHDQSEGIFQCPEIHEENVNFFISWALSSLRAKADRERAQADARHFAEISTMRELVQKAQINAINKVKAEHAEREKVVRNRIESQNKEIEELLNITKQQANQLKTKEEEHEKRLKKLSDMIEKMTIQAKDFDEQIKHMPEIIKQEVTDEITPIRESITNDINDANDHNTDELHKIKDYFDQPLEDAQERTESIQAEADIRSNRLFDENSILLDNKAALAVKMLKDKFRGEKHIREKENKFGIFERRNGLWGVTVKQAKEAEQQIVELIKRMNELCPLDGYD